MESPLPVKFDNLSSVDILNYPQLIGLSLIGTSHQKSELPCQDACRFEKLKSGLLIIAVSDGLGTAKKSDEGSTIAVNSAIQFFSLLPDEGNYNSENFPKLLKNCFEFSRSELFKKSNLDQINVKELGCTLIVVLIFEGNAIAAQIGDGAVVAQTKLGMKLLSEPEEQEYVNEVTPLTSTTWEESLRISSFLSEVEYIAAFTDGCQRAILRKNEGKWIPNDEFLVAFFSHLKEITSKSEAHNFVKKIIESKKFSEISDDDKTLVVALL